MVWCVRNCFHLLFFFLYVSYHENENNEQVLLFITTEAATALRRPCVEHAWYCCAVVTAHSLSITHTHWHAHSLTRSFAHSLACRQRCAKPNNIQTNMHDYSHRQALARERERTGEREMWAMHSLSQPKPMFGVFAWTIFDVQS